MKNPKQDRLTQEALAATNAGMSYGKWKAQQPVQKPIVQQTPKPKEPAARPRPLCRICGKAIPEFSRRRVTCSPECASKADYYRV